MIRQEEALDEPPTPLPFFPPLRAPLSQACLPAPSLHPGGVGLKPRLTLPEWAPCPGQELLGEPGTLEALTEALRLRSGGRPVPTAGRAGSQCGISGRGCPDQAGGTRVRTGPFAHCPAQQAFPAARRTWGNRRDSDTRPSPPPPGLEEGRDSVASAWRRVTRAPAEPCCPTAPCWRWT